MLVREIQNIIRKQMFISYRREYHADAIVVLNNSDAKPYKIEFSLEMTPLGATIVRVKVLDDLDYPLVPIMNELKDRISELDKGGALPA